MPYGRGCNTSLVYCLWLWPIPLQIASSYSYCSPPYSCSPAILCATYNIAIIDDAREIEKETDIETENETSDRILSGWPHFHHIV